MRLARLVPEWEQSSVGALASQHREIGAAVVEVVADYVRTLDSAPVCSTATEAELLALLDRPLPENGTDSIEVLGLLSRNVVAHAMNISSPRYFGLFNPAPLPIAVWVDALCSALNQNGAAWRQSPSATAVEVRVLQWLCDLVGYGERSSGTLTSGGSEANLVAVKCARDAAVAGAAAAGLVEQNVRLRVCASEQCHFSLVKAVDILGIGRIGLRKIDTDGQYRIRVDSLCRTMEKDRAAGYVPCCIVGVAGATSTGAVDSLDQLADLAEEQRVWYHVDAAYGGALAFSPTHAAALRGMERADSVTLDPHKWMFVPFSCGALLTRDGAAVLREAFDTTSEYLDDRSDEGARDFFRHGQLGTRRANALKVWASMLSLGRRGYQQIIERQLDLTRYLASELDRHPYFELLGDVQTAVCCTRFLPDTASVVPERTQDDLQRAVQQRVERSGRAWLATTVLDGRRVLRINVNSLLTRQEHIDDLVAQLVTEGAIAAEHVLPEHTVWLPAPRS